MIRCTCRAPLRARVKRVLGLAGRHDEGCNSRIAGAGMGSDRPLHLEFDSPMFRASSRQPTHPALFRAARQAPVAQLDRAPDYGSGGWEFESSRARHLLGKGRPAIKRTVRTLFERARHSRRNGRPAVRKNVRTPFGRLLAPHEPTVIPSLARRPVGPLCPELIRRERNAVTAGGCRVGLFCINGYIGYNGLADALPGLAGRQGLPKLRRYQ